MSAIDLTVSEQALAGAKAKRLDAFLAESTQESRTFLQNQIQKGNVRLNGKAVTKAGTLVHAGDRIVGEWTLTPLSESVKPTPGNLEIVFEDKDLLVLNKPQGMVVHPAPSHQGATLVHHLLHHMENDEEFADADSDRPGIVHRLDKGTSGLLLVAKNRASQEALSQLFKDRLVKKTYEAVAWGKMELSGRFQSSIGRDRVNRRKMSSRTQKGREAITDWKVEKSFPHFTHVRLFPFTGRTHQLRVHLCESSHPIVGDPLYGRGITEARRQQIPAPLSEAIEQLGATLLHAAELQFKHPTTNTDHHFKAPRPEVFNRFLKLLGDFDA